jgi:DNA-binding MarR family transcriptional regulator
MSERSRKEFPSVLEEIKQSKARSPGQEGYIALLRTADDAKRFATQALEHEGVTLQQYNVLRILRGSGESGLPTLAIAERMVERTPGVTRLIDRMERKGWVIRRRCSEDRRRVWCRITDGGLALLDRLEGTIEEVDATISDVLDPDELRQLVSYLGRLRAHFNEPR